MTGTLAGRFDVQPIQPVTHRHKVKFDGDGHGYGNDDVICKQTLRVDRCRVVKAAVGLGSRSVVRLLCVISGSALSSSSPHIHKRSNVHSKN